MSLAFGPHHLAIPGPSIIPDRVQRAMHRASPNIYEGELVELTKSVITDLKRVANCGGDVAIYHGNGHAVWEASLCNLFSQGDRILVIDTGRFGEGWAVMATGLGIDVTSLRADVDSPVDLKQLAAMLESDTQHEIKAVLAVQTDTAVSSTNDIASLRQTLNDAGHPALLMIDAIASFGCEPFDMEKLDVDVLLSASQKGLMTPPGVALMFVRDRVWSHYETAKLNTPYWDMKPRVQPVMFPDHFCGTPPTHHLYGLREALDILFEEGIENVWRRHQVFAETVWSAVDAWGARGELRCRVTDVNMRSRAVTAVSTGDGQAVRLRQWCEREMGVTLGIGLGSRSTEVILNNVFRIGHMGHLNPPTLLGVLACIDAGLKALDIPHGDSAVEAASRRISTSVSSDY